jgi:hypothetical protein
MKTVLNQFGCTDTVRPHISWNSNPAEVYEDQMLPCFRRMETTPELLEGG